jgi:hypothetical protein
MKRQKNGRTNEGFLDGLKNDAARAREFLTHFGINL